MSTACAGDLLLPIAQAGAGVRVTVRCRPLQARILRRLGAPRIANLVLEETADDR